MALDGSFGLDKTTQKEFEDVDGWAQKNGRRQFLSLFPEIFRELQV